MTKCKKIHGIAVCHLTGEPMSPFSYDKGKKYCTLCDRTFQTDKRCCPCCNSSLRFKPHGKDCKEKLHKRKNDEPTRV